MACGGKSDDRRRAVDVPEDGPIERSLLPAAVAQGLCSLIEDCACLDGTNEEYNDCFDAIERTLERDYGVDGYAIEYDADLARACLAAVEASTCARAQWIGECDLPFTGLRQIGDECAVNIECVGYAAGESICGPAGTCVDPTVPNGIECVATCRGSACARVSDGPGNYTCDNEDGLRCTAGGCAALAQDGGTCTTRFDCQTGLYCSEGTCLPQLSEGEPCDSDAWIPCETGLYCDRTSCIPAEENGAGCSEHYHCQSGYCDGPSEHCMARPDDEDEAVCALLD